jgi:hypothetical protein
MILFKTLVIQKNITYDPKIIRGHEIYNNCWFVNMN